MSLTVREYETADGEIPFRQWLATLDRSVRARIQARVLRFESGNLGDHKSVGAGVLEARVMTGPGYRMEIAPLLKQTTADHDSVVRRKSHRLSDLPMSPRNGNPP